MTSKTMLTALALTAATFTTSVIDASQAARLAADPVAVAQAANPPHVAGFKVPPKSQYAGGVGHTPTALPMPPHCPPPKLPLPGCHKPHP
jgi:hypothetical protein